MGLQLDAQATASASGSGPDASAQGDAASSDDARAEQPFMTVHEQAARSMAAAKLDEERRSPWLRVGVGVAALLGVVVLVVFAGPTIATMMSGAESSDPSKAEGSEPEPSLRPVTPPAVDDPGAAPKPEAGETGAEPAVAETGDTGQAELEDTPEAIVARAEQALIEEHWREPALASLAIELTNLALADPSNEAIGRLRRDAAKTLAPLARKAAKAKDWVTAVAAYRDLLAVWPDHEDGREGFVDALNSLGRAQRSADDYDGLLTTADELLNLEPKMFVALKYRADALAGLERWDEAAPAYRAAMRIRPSNKDAKKGYYRARQKLKAQQP
jgi:tetratricopeptide (TPR) repeat protein